MVVLKSEEQLLNLQPNFIQLLKLSRDIGYLGIIATAKCSDCDFVSRFFAPGADIDEDPVAGSTHCTLTPYWVEVLGKNNLLARQLSPRTGKLRCELQEQTVAINGQACLYLEGLICISA